MRKAIELRPSGDPAADGFRLQRERVNGDFFMPDPGVRHELGEDQPRQRLGGTGLVDLAKRALVVSGVVLLVVLLALGLANAFDVLMLAFAGVLFAILLRSLGDFLSEHTPLGKKWGLTVAVLLFIGSLVAVAWLLIPSIAGQAGQLRESLPKSIGRLEERVKQHEWSRWLLKKAPEPKELAPKREHLFRRVSGAVSGTLNAVGAAVVIFFTGLFFAAQSRLYIEGVVKLAPFERRDRARELLGEIGSALKWWLLGKMASMVFVGVCTWLGLWLLGVQLALTLAVLAALLTFIPNFGPIIAAAPAVLMGLLVSPMTAVWVVVLYIVIQTVESYVFTPMVQQQTVDLPPALTITAQLTMAVLVGGMGLALATPITVVILVLVRSLYIRDMLGDTSV